VAVIPSIMSLFTDFFGGPKLITGDQLKKLANATVSAKAGIVALAGGGLSAATPVMTSAINSVTTVASANDSVALPAAIPGLTISIISRGAQTMNVFAQTSNPQNGGAADQIIAPTSTALVASVTIASGAQATFECAELGIWKRMI